MPARPRSNRTPDGAKRRWTADDRARRTAGRGGAPRQGDRRPDWFPGGRTAEGGSSEGRGADGASSRDRGGRPLHGRPERSGRSFRDERPARTVRQDDRGFSGDRPARPDRGRDHDDRAPRAFRDDRDFRGGRASRDDRGSGGQRIDHGSRGDRQDRAPREERSSRPSREDRGFREDRGPREDRAFREDRGFRGDRGSRDDRGAGGDRAPRASRDDRGRTDDRPRRDDRRDGGDGWTRQRDERPFRGRTAEHGVRGPRPDRAPRADDRRPPRRDDHRQDPRRDDHRQDPRRDDHRRDERAPHWEAPEDVVLERLEAEVVTAQDVAGSSFAGLGLGPRITDALAELGATEPFPIQSATIPAALEGRDVLGRGRTGSGKTIAFGAALVERLMRNWAESGRSGTGRKPGRAPRALIMAPTRELALQIDRTVQPLARAVGLYTTQIVGGVPQARQVGALSKGVDIVIGTPGRIEDLLEQGRLDLSQIEIAVLDEADHMAELGFLEPMQRLLRRIPEGGQRMLFSATLDSAIAQLVDEFLTDPSVHEVADPEGAGSADHRVLVIEPGEKLSVLTALIDAADRTLVFARTRAFAEQLADDLEDAGVRAESLHGDLNQSRRTRALQRFTEGRVAALVATDVAARGIHVDAIDLVVHADAAEDYKTYLHRSGRTGRAGASGTVVTLINPRRRRRFTELLDRAEIEARFTSLHPGDDPVAALRP